MDVAAETELTRTDGQDTRQPRVRALEFVRKHPYMMGLLVGGAVLGAVVGAALPMGDLSLIRRLIGGAVAGFYFALFPLGFRLFE